MVSGRFCHVHVIILHFSFRVLFCRQGNHIISEDEQAAGGTENSPSDLRSKPRFFVVTKATM
jgi:hypothetical protein